MNAKESLCYTTGVPVVGICISVSILIGICDRLPYFFDYKTEIFSFQNSPKDLDPSYKMDLDLWDCLGRVKLVL